MKATTTCPCCKSLRVMDEAIRHPSLTSMIAAKQANQAFREENIPAHVEALAKCPTHGSPEALDHFWEEYDRKVDAINGAARTRVMNVLFRRSGRVAAEPRR